MADGLTQIRADISHAFFLAKRFEERREDTQSLVKLDAAEARVAAFLNRREAEQENKSRVPWCGRCECYHYYGNCV